MWTQFVLVCSKDYIFCVDLGFLEWSRKSCFCFIGQLQRAYGITVWFGNLAIQVKSLHEDCMPGKYSSEDHWEKIIFVP